MPFQKTALLAAVALAISSLCDGQIVDLLGESEWTRVLREASYFDAYERDLSELGLRFLEKEYRTIASDIARGEGAPRIHDLPVICYRICRSNAFGEPSVIEIRAYPSKDKPKEISRDRIKISFKAKSLSEIVHGDRILNWSEFEGLMEAIERYELFSLPILRSAPLIVEPPTVGSIEPLTYFEACIAGDTKLVIREPDNSPAAKEIADMILQLARVGLCYDPFEWYPEKAGANK